MPQITPAWAVNDQTPDNPYGKSTDYESYLNYLVSNNVAKIAVGQVPKRNHTMVIPSGRTTTTR